MQGMRQQMIAPIFRAGTSKFRHGGNDFFTRDLERGELGLAGHADDHMLNADIAQLAAIVDRVARGAVAQIHTSDRSALDFLEQPADPIALASENI